MSGSVCLGVKVKGGEGDSVRTVFSRGKLHLVDAVLDARLLFAGDVHDVKGKEFAGDARKGDV